MCRHKKDFITFPVGKYADTTCFCPDLSGMWKSFWVLIKLCWHKTVTNMIMMIIGLLCLILNVPTQTIWAWVTIVYQAYNSRPLCFILSFYFFLSPFLNFLFFLSLFLFLSFTSFFTLSFLALLLSFLLFSPLPFFCLQQQDFAVRSEDAPAHGGHVGMVVDLHACRYKQVQEIIILTNCDPTWVLKWGTWTRILNKVMAKNV